MNHSREHPGCVVKYPACQSLAELGIVLLTSALPSMLLNQVQIICESAQLSHNGFQCD